jgi:hypothetical protein
METIDAGRAMNYKFPYRQNYAPPDWPQTFVSLYGNFRPLTLRFVIVSYIAQLWLEHCPDLTSPPFRGRETFWRWAGWCATNASNNRCASTTRRR